MAGVETRALPEGQILYFQIRNLPFLSTVVFGTDVRGMGAFRQTITFFGHTSLRRTKFVTGSRTDHCEQVVGECFGFGSMNYFDETSAG
jgi:hypothetical protein